MSDTSDSTRIVLDYTSRDFAAIRTQLVGLAKGFMPEWETAGETGDMGTLILELFAYMGDVMNFYIDRAASEAFLGTALRRQSVLYIADMFGYKPVGQHSASVRLIFNIMGVDEDVTEPLTLPKGTRIYTSENNSLDTIVFELDAPVTLTPAATGITTPVDVVAYATEGITTYDVRIGTSFGSPALSLMIPEPGVVAGSISVNSREGGQIIKWDHISDISLGRPTQSVFTSFIDDYGNTHLLFGDNASGRIPPVNAEIYASYRIGVGRKANDIPANKLELIGATADLSDRLWAVSVRNPSNPVGGTDPESTDSMRFSIPRAAGRIRNRAITLGDYAGLALQVPGVAKSTAYGTLYTAIHVRIAPNGGVGDDATMARLCAEAEVYLADKVLVGSAVTVEPEDIDELWHSIYIRVMVHVQPAYNRTTVRVEVDRVIRAMLAFDAVDFGTRISVGLLYRTILSVEGVEWADLTWLSPTRPTPTQELTLDTNSAIQSVLEVNTDVLLIPQIYKYVDVNEDEVADGTTLEFVQGGSVIEADSGTNGFPPATYPHLKEESERTHDGLWVKADGGLVDT